ncbi:hypothetical protein B0H65DRAFT_170728 [Neurospora tetraspora]|uniref:Uncharacterized protein n=1 Tax=Neurospora tetraspora TaxID=94610 RepID=A0AAE0MT63_9PEZI|nr:hypothetical protein B0H65DRAFT_170728 [Neurospora tetraspora]
MFPVCLCFTIPHGLIQHRIRGIVRGTRSIAAQGAATLPDSTGFIPDAEPNGWRMSTIPRCRMLTSKSSMVVIKAWYLKNGTRNRIVMKFQSGRHSFCLPTIKAAQEITTCQNTVVVHPAALLRLCTAEHKRIKLSIYIADPSLHSGHSLSASSHRLRVPSPIENSPTAGISLPSSRSSGNGQKRHLPLTDTYISPSSSPHTKQHPSSTGPCPDWNLGPRQSCAEAWAQFTSDIPIMTSNRRPFQSPSRRFLLWVLTP